MVVFIEKQDSISYQNGGLSINDIIRIHRLALVDPATRQSPPPY